MNTKSVCIIRSNAVRPDSRVEKEAWSLTKTGYAVYILAWDRDDNHREKEEIINVVGIDIPITRLGYKASFGEGFKNIKPYLKFQFHMLMWLRKHSFDVIHACDFDTAFFSLGIAKLKKEKFVFDIFDFIYCEPHSIFQKMIKRAQLYMISKADATIICTENRKKQIEGSKPNKLTVIHNTPSTKLLKSKVFNKVVNNRVKIVYVGILQEHRLLREIGHYFTENQSIELHIGGFGIYGKYFKELSDRCLNIYYYGRIPYNKTLELESSCDIMLAIYDPLIDNHKYAAPNKFYESLMLGRPVVMAKGTGMSDVVIENDIGVVIEYSKEGFSKGINQLINRKEDWEAMGQRSIQLYEKKYSWETMENRLVELYKQL